MMKMKDVKDIIDTSGNSMKKFLRPKSKVTPWAEALGIFGVGLLVGAGVALLLAPQSGERTREKLGRKLRAVRAGGPDKEVDKAASPDGIDSAVRRGVSPKGDLPYAKSSEA